MFGFGLTELVLILVVVLLVFGGKKLPQLGQGLGESVRGFRRAFRERQGDAEKPEKPDKP